MRKMTYTMGSIEAKTYAEAQELREMFGKPCKVVLTEIREREGKLSPIRQMCLERFGRVTPELCKQIREEMA